jgi:hypothetical protein
MGRPPRKQPKPPLSDEQRSSAVKILLTDSIRRHTGSQWWTPETLSDLLVDKYVITGPRLEQRPNRKRRTSD